MDLTEFQCSQCPMILNDSQIESHISAQHLEYFPLECTWCKEENQMHFSATREDMKQHMSKYHNGNNSRYSVLELVEDVKEDELKKLAKECRRLIIPHIPLNVSFNRVWNVPGAGISTANGAETFPGSIPVEQEYDDDVIVIEEDSKIAMPNNSSGVNENGNVETDGKSRLVSITVAEQSLQSKLENIISIPPIQTKDKKSFKKRESQFRANSEPKMDEASKPIEDASSLNILLVLNKSSGEYTRKPITKKTKTLPKYAQQANRRCRSVTAQTKSGTHCARAASTTFLLYIAEHKTAISRHAKEQGLCFMSSASRLYKSFKANPFARGHSAQRAV